MGRQLNLIVTFAFFVLVLCGCTSSDDEPAINEMPRSEISLSRSQQENLNNESRFAFDFLKAVNSREETGENLNIAISPLSMARDLSMLACGASDNTLDEILKVLHLEKNASIEELNALNCQLLEGLLKADNNVTLTVSNSFWYEKNHSIKNSYTKMIEDNYRAVCNKVDFKSSSILETINKWSENSTNGIITDMLNPEDLIYAKFILLDAVYFKGYWSTMFSEKLTMPMPFYNSDDIVKDVETMNGNVLCGIGGDETTTVLQVPYGNKAFSMYFCMADEGNDINDIISQLTFEKWTLLKSSLITKGLTISIPKFEISFNPQLEDVMTELGLQCGNPKLSNMSDREVEVLKIRQKSCVKIDESGAEAASVSAIIGGETLARPTEIENVKINRPFVFLIEEYSTGAILFMGKVERL